MMEEVYSPAGPAAVGQRLLAAVQSWAAVDWEAEQGTSQVVGKEELVRVTVTQRSFLSTRKIRLALLVQTSG